MTWAQRVQLGLVLKIAFCHLELHEHSLRFNCQLVPRFSWTWVIVAVLGVAILRYHIDDGTVWILNGCGLSCLVPLAEQYGERAGSLSVLDLIGADFPGQ